MGRDAAWWMKTPRGRRLGMMSSASELRIRPRLHRLGGSCARLVCADCAWCYAIDGVMPRCERYCGHCDDGDRRLRRLEARQRFLESSSSDP